MSILLLIVLILSILMILFFFYTKYEIIFNPKRFTYNKHGLYYDKKDTALVSNYCYIRFWDKHKRKWVYLMDLTNSYFKYYSVEHETFYKPKLEKDSFNTSNIKKDFIDGFKSIKDVYLYNEKITLEYNRNLKNWEYNKPRKQII